MNTLGADDENVNSERDLLSKATFTSKESGETVEIDDPDFWRKVLGNEAVEKKEETPALLDRNQRQSRKRKVDYSEKSIWTNAAISDDDDEEYEDEENVDGVENLKRTSTSRRKSKAGVINRPLKSLKDDALTFPEMRALMRKIFMSPWTEWDTLNQMMLRAASYKSEVQYVNESMERPVLAFCACLRFIAAAAESFEKEGAQIPSLEDAYDAPQRMSNQFLCLDRFLKSKDQWRRDTQRLTMMRSVISNVRAGISIALKQDEENPRFSVEGVRREIERGLSFEDTPEHAAAWEAKEKAFLKQYLDHSELWSICVSLKSKKRNGRENKESDDVSTTTTVVDTNTGVTNTDTSATTTTIVDTNTAATNADTSATTTTVVDTNTAATNTDASATTTTTVVDTNTAATNTDTVEKKKRKAGRTSTSFAHGTLRQLETTLDLGDMYKICKTEDWKSIQALINVKCSSSLFEDWNESDDRTLISGVQVFGRFQKSMTKLWNNSFANRFAQISSKKGHGMLMKRIRDLVRTYRLYLASRRNQELRNQRDEQRRQERQRKAILKEQLKESKRIEREKAKELRAVEKKRKLEEKALEKKRKMEERQRIREEKRQRKEQLKNEAKRRMQEKQQQVQIFKKRKIMGKDSMSLLMRKWVGSMSTKPDEEISSGGGGGSSFVKKRKRKYYKKNKKKPRVVLPPGDTPIKLLQENPKRGMSFERYEVYKKAKTIDEFFELGGSTGDVKYDIDLGYLKILRPDGTEEKPTRHVYEWGDVVLTFFGAPKPNLKPPPIRDPEHAKQKAAKKRKTQEIQDAVIDALSNIVRKVCKENAEDYTLLVGEDTKSGSLRKGVLSGRKNANVAANSLDSLKKKKKRKMKSTSIRSFFHSKT